MFIPTTKGWIRLILVSLHSMGGSLSVIPETRCSLRKRVIRNPVSYLCDESFIWAGGGKYIYCAMLSLLISLHSTGGSLSVISETRCILRKRAIRNPVSYLRDVSFIGVGGGKYTFSAMLFPSYLPPFHGGNKEGSPLS
jgi:hypothetical protein